MSLKQRVDKLLKLIKPKATMRFILDESEMTDEKGVIWVLFKY